MKHRLFAPYLKSTEKSGVDYKLLFSAMNSVRTVGDITLILGVLIPKWHMIWGNVREF